MEEIIQKYPYDLSIKLDNFEKYIRRQAMSRFLARYELFKKIINVEGDIIECGVYYGGGFMAWAKLSSALEPYAIKRKIIGFDSFDGFQNISEKDQPDTSITSQELKKGGFATNADVYNELLDCIKLYDSNRFLNQFPKAELVKGDATQIIPEFIRKNQHLVIALLFLDFDLYEPTKVALKHFLPRIPKGGAIAFDEINNESWPGETAALIEEVKSLNGISLQKFDFDPNISFAILP